MISNSIIAFNTLPQPKGATVGDLCWMPPEMWLGLLLVLLNPSLVWKNGEIEIQDVQNVNFAIKVQYH